MSTAVAIKQTNEQMSIARQRLDGQVPAATKIQAKINVLLDYNDRNGVFFWVRPEAD